MPEDTRNKYQKLYDEQYNPKPKLKERDYLETEDTSFPCRLASETIERLATQPKVRAIAVENFLGSATDDCSKITDAYFNLELDSASYHWNAPTVNAILEGLRIWDRKCCKKEWV